jgi:hypothetical protein
MVKTLDLEKSTALTDAFKTNQDIIHVAVFNLAKHDMSDHT